MRVRSKKDIFDLGKKMTVDKGEMLLCVVWKPLFNEAEKEKKNSRNEHERLWDLETLLFFLALSKILTVCGGCEIHGDNPYQ